MPLLINNRTPPAHRPDDGVGDERDKDVTRTDYKSTGMKGTHLKRSSRKVETSFLTGIASIRRSNASFLMLMFILAVFFLMVQMRSQERSVNSFDSSLRRIGFTGNMSNPSTINTTHTDDLSPMRNMNSKNTSDPLLAPGRYVHPNKIYGTIHIAKTGGTSLNGILANKFERVCGHKGYTYDAYRSNEKVKQKPESINMNKASRDRVNYGTMEEIGYENCDYVSHETKYKWWINQFGNESFHGIPMELHVPCRNPIDHLMSQCNYQKRRLNCTGSEKDFFNSIGACLLELTRRRSRFNHELAKHFQLKCFDFKNQFTGYVEYMSERLQPRRLISKPYVKRETNKPRDKENECIWKRPDLMEKAHAHLMKRVDYYQFCAECMGSENEIK
jgi:hypothetical protein